MPEEPSGICKKPLKDHWKNPLEPRERRQGNLRSHKSIRLGWNFITREKEAYKIQNKVEELRKRKHWGLDMPSPSAGI